MSRVKVAGAALWVALATCSALAVDSALAVEIDNDVPAGTVGHLAVDVTTAGETRTVALTAIPSGATEPVTVDVIYDYFTYVDVGIDGGGFRLIGTEPVRLEGDEDAVMSSGSFLLNQGGEDEQTIQWTATTSIEDGTTTLTNVFTFSAETGTLGPMRLYQYMDEDVSTANDPFGASNDVFFTRGSVANGSLELFTVDNVDVFGVSHAGALIEEQGLVSAFYAGWAADVWDRIKPMIEGPGQPVAPEGLNAVTPPFEHPEVGDAFGPKDIVSVLAWDVNPDASTATIVTTLGGVPDPIFPPVCESLVIRPESIEGDEILDGFATDQLPSDTGVFSVELLGSVNLTLTVDGSFTPGDPNVSFTVERTEPLLAASGSVRVTDGSEKSCTFPAISLEEVFIPHDPTVSGWVEGIDVRRGALSYAFLATQEDGLIVYDVTQPDEISEVGVTVPSAENCPVGHFFDDVSLGGPTGALAVVAGGPCGVLVYDATDPTAEPLPLLGRLVVHKGWVESMDVLTPGEEFPELPPLGFAPSHARGLQILDLSDPVDPKVLGAAGDQQEAFGEAIAVDAVQVGNRILAFTATTNALRVIDATNPSAPLELASFDTDADSGEVPQDIAVRNGFAYLPTWQGDFLVLNVSDPEMTPTVLQRIPTSLAFFKVTLSQSGAKAYVSEGLEGLRIFDITPSGLLAERAPFNAEAGFATEFQNGEDCCWAWAVEEVDGTVYASWGSFAPRGGGFQMVDVEPPPPGACGLVGMEAVALLLGVAIARERRRAQRA